MSSEQSQESAKKKAAMQQVQQQLLACLRSPWSSIALVPAQPGTSAAAIGEALANAAWLVRGKEAKVFPVEGLDVAGVSRVIVEIDAHVAAGGVAVAVIEPVVTRQSGIPVALAADGVVLCVHLGVTEIDNARKTVDLIGEQKFLGAITIESSEPA